MDEKNQEINESNASKRLRMLGENMDERIHSEKDEIKKGNFWHNLWYQQKWTIIICAFLLIVFVIFLTMCIKDKRSEEDILIYYAGPVQVNDTASQNTLTNALEQIAKDNNGNGRCDVQLVSMALYASNQLQNEDGEPFTTTEIGRNAENINTFKNQLMSGEFSIILIDKSLYEEQFKDQFVSLSSLDIDAGEAQYDSCSIYLKKTEFGSYFDAFDKLPNDTLIVVNQKVWNANEDKYNAHIDYLKTLLAYTK